MTNAQPRRARALIRGGARFALGLVVLAVAVAIAGALVRTRPHAAASDRPEFVRPVRVMVASRVPVERWWEGYGTLRARHEADISSEVAGIVAERPDRIDAGASVENGELLIRLDGREFADRLARSEATIRALESGLRRLDIDIESLDEQARLADEAVATTAWEIEQLTDAQRVGGASRVELERLRRELTIVRREAEELRRRRNQIPVERARIEAQIESERAAARLADLDLERTRIVAPIMGTLQFVEADVGERIAPGERVARIVDLRRLEIPMRVPVSAAPEVRIGDPAQVRAGGVAHEARVSRIAPEADPQTRTITVFVEVEQEVEPGRPPALIPGLFVIGRIRAGGESSGLVVPRRAVDADRVMVVGDDGRAAVRRVRIGHYVERDYPGLEPGERQWAVIADGLEPGDRVITSNLDDLIGGTPVRSEAETDSRRASRNGGDES